MTGFASSLSATSAASAFACAASAREEAERMCSKLLANPVTEDYDIEVAE